MSINRTEYRIRMRQFQEVCKIIGEGCLTITENDVILTTEDGRVIGLDEVATFMDITLTDHWEKDSLTS